MKQFEVGQTATLERTFSAENVRHFAELSGDDNPLHLDPEYAAQTRFGRCIVHGTFYTAVLGTIMGTKLPGPGTVLLHQEHNFFKPVFLDDTVVAAVSVTGIKEDKRVLYLGLQCLVSEEVVMTGRAVVMVG